MKYEELAAITKDEVRKSLGGSTEEASEALLRAALSISDRDWVESVLVDAMSDERWQVRRAAIVGLDT